MMIFFLPLQIIGDLYDGENCKIEFNSRFSQTIDWGIRGWDQYSMPEDFVKPNPNSFDEFVVFTVPKSGTNLISEVFRIYLGMDQDYFSIFANYAKSVEACSNHIQNLKENNLFGITHDGFSEYMYYILLGSDCRIYFMIRDPRDVFISYIDWIDNGRGPNVIDPNEIWWKEKTLEEKITCLLREEFNFTGKVKRRFSSVFSERIGWLRQPEVCVVTFEKLIGSKGGGNDDLQAQELQKILKHINIDESDRIIRELGQRVYGMSNTFNKGQIGRWKEIFTEEHIQLSKELLGEILIELGYEEGLDW